MVPHLRHNLFRLPQIYCPISDIVPVSPIECTTPCDIVPVWSTEHAAHCDIVPVWPTEYTLWYNTSLTHWMYNTWYNTSIYSCRNEWLVCQTESGKCSKIPKWAKVLLYQKGQEFCQYQEASILSYQQGQRVLSYTEMQVFCHTKKGKRYVIQRGKCSKIPQKAIVLLY